MAEMISHYFNNHNNKCNINLLIAVSAYSSKHETQSLRSVLWKAMSTPFDIIKILADTIRNRVRKSNKKAFLQQAAQHDRKTIEPKYRVREYVNLRNPMLKKGQAKKFKVRWKSPYQILEVMSPVKLKLQLTFRTIVLHTNHMKQHVISGSLATDITEETD
ncbi:hypothetical protein PR048_011336 [Dryococelus australis]|uniref:Uncharacterized protein n=1 Tax=Dryococelus australis TaxID=614101 RepID=A0ABQ9HLH8_9NEOP|nr:hypothetical protein PR048_011336 [Dryococelus australis]